MVIQQSEVDTTSQYVGDSNSVRVLVPAGKQVWLITCKSAPPQVCVPLRSLDCAAHRSLYYCPESDLQIKYESLVANTGA